jgi:hypothetical protein
MKFSNSISGFRLKIRNVYPRSENGSIIDWCQLLNSAIDETWSKKWGLRPIHQLFQNGEVQKIATLAAASTHATFSIMTSETLSK